VEVYRVLPANGEPELIHAAIPQHASVLELACGTGRVAGPLARLGHEVTGVDDSAAMIEAMDPDVVPVLGDVRSIRLRRRFDVVLVISHLLNDPDPTAFLRTAAAHMAPGGTLVAEVYPADFDWQASIGRTTTLGPVAITVSRARVAGRRIDASVRYQLGDQVWDQPFVASMRDEAALRSILAAAGLAFSRWLERPGWLIAYASG
jgi:SAM-dependent methyltransferase